MLFIGAISVIKEARFVGQLKTKTDVAAIRIADSLSVPLWVYITEACDRILRSELRDGDFGAIYLRDKSGALISASAKTGPGGTIVRVEDAAIKASDLAGIRVSSTAAVTYNETTIGEVTVYATGADGFAALVSEIAQQAIIAFLEGAIVALLVFLAIDRLISRRVLRLELDIGRFSEKALSVRSRDRADDEIGALAASFNRMAETIQRHAEGLESMVADRTRELENANAELKDANDRLSSTVTELRQAQDVIVETRKAAALGHLVAGIAHQLNTPLGAISSANRSMANELNGRILRISHELAGIDEVDAAILDEMLEESLASEEASDFSSNRAWKHDLTALFNASGIADAENLADLAVEANIQGLGSRLVEFLSTKRIRKMLGIVEAVSEIRKASLVIGTASEKAANVIRALKVYLGQSPMEGRSSLVLATEIDVVLALFRHATREGVMLETRFDRDLSVIGLREQLDLVWMNLIDNSIQAMSGKGRLTITIERKGEFAAVQVIDSGPGISAEIKDRIFEPFFSTRPQESNVGLGLGLSTSKRIVEDHDGSISFVSEKGKTVFTVVLPALPMSGYR